MFSFGSVSQTAGFEVVKALPLSSTLIFSKINGHAAVAVAVLKRESPSKLVVDKGSGFKGSFKS